MGRNFTPEVLQALDAPFRNALAPRQGLVFDGTGVTTFVNVPALGTRDFSVAWVFNAASFAGTQNFIGGPLSGQFALRYAGGAFYTSKFNAADNAPRTVALAAGTTYSLVYVRSGTTATYYLDGVSVATSPDAQDYTTGSQGLGGINGTAFNGGLSLLGIYNRALSATEVSALYREGAPAAADYNAASNTALAGSDLSTWTAAGTASIVSGTATVGVATNWVYKASILQTGKRYRIVATTVTGSIKLYDENISLASGVPVEFTATNGAGTLILHSASTGTVAGVSVYPVGLLCAPESNAPGNGLVWNDQSGNGAHILLPHVSGKMTGVTWALPGGGRNSVGGTTNTLGNQQIFGAGCVVFDAVGGNPTCRIARVFARARTGTPSVTLGYSSGGNQYATATTLAIGWKVVAAGAESVAATTSLWAGSSSADVVEWRVMIEPIKV